MIAYKSRWLSYVELWFDESCPGNDVDVMVRYRANASVPGASNEEFYTLVVDLRKSEQDILAGFHRNTRSKIKRALSEDNLSYEVMGTPSREAVNEFVEHYHGFARAKGIPALDPAYYEHLRAAGKLVLSRIRNKEHTLVWHSHLRIGSCAMLMHSASLYRGRDAEFQKLVGRANRLHHWKDMLFFKDNACSHYDFDGWYPGTEDQDRLKINQFKEEFGGSKILQYNAVLNRTWRAKLLKSLRRFVYRAG